MCLFWSKKKRGAKKTDMITNKEISGDIAVDGDTTIGGDAKVRGSVAVGHNLRVDGWLEARNIKSCNKGLYSSEERLRAAYPNPLPGWWALVGERIPAQMYVVEEGAWRGQTDADGNAVLCEDISVDTRDFNAIVEEVRGEITEVEEKAETIKGDIGEIREVMEVASGILANANEVGNEALRLSKEIESDLKSFHADYKEVKDDFILHKAESVLHKSNYEQLKKHFEEYTTDADERIGSNETAITGVETSIADVQKKVADNATTAAQATQQCEAISTELQDVETDLMDLHRSYNTHKQAFEALREDVETGAGKTEDNTRDIDSLTTSLGKTNVQLATTNAMVNLHTQQYNAMKERVDLHDVQIPGLEQGIQALQSTKVPVSDFNRRMGQFGLTGKRDAAGAFSDGSNYVRTGMLPLNRNYDVVAQVSNDSTMSAVTFYSATGTVLETHKLSASSMLSVGTVTVAKGAFPPTAVYFEVCTKTSDKDKCFWENGASVEARSAAVKTAADDAAKADFIKQWLNLGVMYHYNCDFFYDATTDTFSYKSHSDNEEGKAYVPTFTYRQAELALAVVQAPVLGYDSICPAKIPANLPLLSYNTGSGPCLNVMDSNICLYNEDIQILVLASQGNGSCKVFNNEILLTQLPKLKAIIGHLYSDTLGNKNPLRFYLNFPKLEYFRVRIKQSFNCATSPLLTYGTVAYLVNYAKNTAPITITVHPEVYAKLTSTDAEYADWAALVDTAKDKDITFATPTA